MPHDTRKLDWPHTTNKVKTPATTVILTVNYNTKPLIAQLIWSAYRNLGSTSFARLLVIDNNSSDGSQAFLRGIAEKGFIEYIEHQQNLYHGPALNHGFDYLAERQAATEQINAIWVLDSDCAIVRPDTLTAATELMTEIGAAILGQPVDDAWHSGDFGLHSLLIDPAQVWRDPIAPFEEHGEPSKHLQESCVNTNLKCIPFSFTNEGYVIHVGRGTLAEVAKQGDEDNVYYRWALTHSTPHFADEATTKKRYADLHLTFVNEVPSLTLEHFVEVLGSYKTS